ncbi:MAG: hypothetical protein Q4B64_10735 [Spirochaetales bacterium]|nr:hypothetical protein [Spirochaetales bacterium]
MIKSRKIETIRAGKIDERMYNEMVSNQFGEDYGQRLLLNYSQAKNRETESKEEGLAYSTLLQLYNRGLITRDEMDSTVDGYKSQQKEKISFVINGEEKSMSALPHGELLYDEAGRELSYENYDVGINFREYSEDGTFKEYWYEMKTGETEEMSDPEEKEKEKVISDDSKIELFKSDDGYQMLGKRMFDETGKLVKVCCYQVIEDC